MLNALQSDIEPDFLLHSTVCEWYTFILIVFSFCKYQAEKFPEVNIYIVHLKLNQGKLTSNNHEDGLGTVKVVFIGRYCLTAGQYFLIDIDLLLLASKKKPIITDTFISE